MVGCVDGGPSIGRIGPVGLLGVLLLCSFEGAARAQSTASFPTPVSTPPSKPVPVPSAPVPPSRSTVPQPVPSANAATSPAAHVAVAPPARPAPVADNAPSLPAPPPATYSLAPALLPYRSGLPVPPGYKVEHRSANGLIIGGAASLLVGYVTAIAVGGGDSFKNGTGWVVLPVIGPWAAIGARSYHCENTSALDVVTAQQSANTCVRGAFNEVQTIAILSADAVVQATGAVLFLAGLASGEEQLVRTDVAGVRVTPRALGRDGFGVGFDGRF